MKFRIVLFHITLESGFRELVKLDTFTITEQRCIGILANTRFCWVVMDYNKISRDSLRISGFTAKQLFALAMEMCVCVCEIWLRIRVI